MTLSRRSRSLLAGLLLAVSAVVAGCGFLPGVDLPSQSEIRCGRFEGIDCNDLLELGLDAVMGGRLDTPSIIAIDGACPPNARCVRSALGGETVAVVVRWSDGTTDWATIPLPDDWPDSPPGVAEAQDGPLPDHLRALIGPGD